MKETSILPDTSKNDKPYDMEPNIEAMFAYLPLLGLFTSLAILIMEKENEFVRFHALQGLLFAIIFYVINSALRITFFLFTLIPIINLLAFLIWGFMMWKAYEKEKFELPIIGKVAKDQIK